MGARTNARRWTALVMTAVAQAGLLLAGAAPAGAIPGLVAADPKFSNVNSDTIKTLIGECPTNTVLLGISGVVDDFNANAVRLTYLEPMSKTLFRVIAAAPTGFAQQWQLAAAARCAPEPAGYEIVPATTTPSSSTFKEAIARCPGTKIAIGSAARLEVTSEAARQVGLQLLRTSGPMDIVRATGREDADGFSGNWAVTAYAICVNGVPGQAPAPGGPAFGTPETFVVCPNNTFVHGYGGGGSTTDVTGNVWLNQVSASSQTATVSFTGVPGDGVVAQAICAP